VPPGEHDGGQQREEKPLVRPREDVRDIGAKELSREHRQVDELGYDCADVFDLSNTGDSRLEQG
jgi:hypothetical protein